MVKIERMSDYRGVRTQTDSYVKYLNMVTAPETTVRLEIMPHYI